MTAEGPSFFSRDEVLGGMHARRASTVLFAIEARAAHLVARSRRAMARHDTERTSSQRERAFLEALAGARELPLTPTVQDVDRYAPQWTDLAPADPDLRASVARLLGQKYRLPAHRVGRIRSALGLDEASTREAFARAHGEPLESIYVPSLRARERVAWIRSRLARRLEELPPFWMAYALALTETIGEGILALPIALAGIGPLPGVVALVVLGVLNLLTIGGIVESITRDGEMRYGTAYFGRLASSLLGRAGASTITVSLFVFNIVILLTYLLAFSAPLADATGVDAAVWVAVLFAVNLFFLRRDLDATVASALIIGAINVGLIVAIALVALTHVDPDHLRFARWPFADEVGTSAFLLVFGVVIVAYFGHTSAGNVAKLVLDREPSGRALFWGNVAAIATVILLYSLVVITINGAIDPKALIGYEGTAFEPLADVAGGSVAVLGSAYVVLAIGLGSIYVSLGLFNQVREWLPRGAAGAETASAGIRSFDAGDLGGFLLGALPMIAVFVALEILLALDAASFSDPLSLIGTLTIPLLGGVFPMLLLAASRRSGERVPGSWVRVLKGPVSMGLIALLFFVGLLVQGLVVWQRPLERTAAAGVALVIVAVVWSSIRRRAFGPRTVVELRREPDGSGAFGVVVGGRSETAFVRFEGAGDDETFRASDGTVERLDGIRTATFELPPTQARRLKVWVHGVTRAGDSEPLAALVRVRSAAEQHELAVDARGVAVTAVSGEPAEVAIELGGRSR